MPPIAILGGTPPAVLAILLAKVDEPPPLPPARASKSNGNMPLIGDEASASSESELIGFVACESAASSFAVSTGVINRACSLGDGSFLFIASCVY